MNMFDYINQTASKYPKNTALSFFGKKTSYLKLINKINKTASCFKKLNIKKGDIVCVAMPNAPQAIISIYALNKLGATVNMIHPLSAENEFLNFINKVNAKVILVLDTFYDKILNIIDKTQLEHIIVANISDELNTVKKIGYNLTTKKIKIQKSDKIILWRDFIKLSDNVALNEQSNDNIALILHSGGTTGKIKGVCLSNENVNNSALQMIEANPMINSNDRFLSVMPIFHGNGLVIGVHAMLMIGARCVLVPRFTPQSYAKDLIKNRCNYMSGVPALFEKLMQVKIMKKSNLKFLKGVFSGADYLSVELERKINGFLTLHNSPVLIRQGYGMTEGVVATTLNPVSGQKEGSIGLPLPNVKVKIVKPDTDTELPVGDIGEIVFSSVTNMIGYYNDEKETAITKKMHSDGQFWIHSGDLGSMDKDGFFYFKGRIKRVIVKNGYNVFPNELENIIEGFSVVDRCCVLGVDNNSTQSIKAFILLKEGVKPNEQTKTEIAELFKKSIAKYAIPKQIEFIKEMPKTKVGKIDYNSLLNGNYIKAQ